MLPDTDANPPDMEPGEFLCGVSGDFFFCAFPVSAVIDELGAEQTVGVPG
jgi:hypothetical protein